MNEIMKKQLVFTILAAFLTFTSVHAQPHKKAINEKLEKYRAEKISFLTSKLDLTPAEAQEFWPVYNQLEKERWEAQKMRREMEEKIRLAEDDMTKTEITRLTREYAGSLQKEANMLVEYNEKFLKILPPEKVLNLYKSENEFRMYMIKKFRDHRKSDRD
jgi:hypothetical protein